MPTPPGGGPPPAGNGGEPWAGGGWRSGAPPAPPRPGPERDRAVFPNMAVFHMIWAKCQNAHFVLAKYFYYCAFRRKSAEDPARAGRQTPPPGRNMSKKVPNLQTSRECSSLGRQISEHCAGFRGGRRPALCQTEKVWYMNIKRKGAPGGGDGPRRTPAPRGEMRTWHSTCRSAWKRCCAFWTA